MGDLCIALRGSGERLISTRVCEYFKAFSLDFGAFRSLVNHLNGMVAAKLEERLEALGIIRSETWDRGLADRYSTMGRRVSRPW
jgi:hypothetical protein